MISTTIDWRSPVRNLYVGVGLYQGSTLIQEFFSQDRLKNFKIERVGNESKFFGFGVCQKLNLHLIDVNRELNLTTSHKLKVKIYGYDFGGALTNIDPFPEFFISEVHRDEVTNELSITAYDALYPAAAHTVSELGLVAPYSISNVASKITTLLGLNLYKFSNMSADAPQHTTYPSGANFDGAETIREVLDAIAEATQSVYYINRDNILTFKRPNIDSSIAQDCLITKEDYFTLDSKTNRRLSDICCATELGDNVITESGTIGTVQYVRDNPFWELREDITTLLNNALAAIGGITINQFECEWRGNPGLEIADKIAMIGKDNKYIFSYVFDDVIEYDGALRQHTRWKYEGSDNDSIDNPVSLGDALKQTYARVDKANKNIEIVASDVSTTKEEVAGIKLDTQNISITVKALSDDTAENFEEIGNKLAEAAKNIESANNGISANAATISSLSVNANDISASVVAVSKVVENGFETVNNNVATLTELVNTKATANDINISIQKALSDGVDKITTSTGFTFNEEGLHVNKSGSEITTSITEDGMTVYKENKEVLVADNLGVRAEDLHATTYLIIGKNSRFEDYDTSRTGCFWMGN